MNEYLIYEQDTCIGSVFAENEDDAYQKAMIWCNCHGPATFYLQKVRNDSQRTQSDRTNCSGACRERNILFPD